MFMGFLGGIFISFLLMMEGMKKSSKFMGFLGGIFISFLLMMEGMNYDQNTWDMSLKYPLMFLTFSLLPPTYLAFNQKSFLSQSSKSYLIFLCFFLLFMVFLVEAFWSFFIFFELSVIPILLMISSQGGSKSRMEASKFLFIFTSGSSLILLFFLAWSSAEGCWEMIGWISSPPSEMESKIYLFFSMIVLSTFFVKMPSLFVHMWLPKAHVEAPVFGSMVLASVMLKMGGYGILLLSPLMDFFITSMAPTFLFFFFSFYAALVCFNQKDLKILIAYSSVNHMALVIMAAVVGWSFGFTGAMLLMLGHGVVSSILFFLSSVSYNQSSSRSLMIASSSSKDYLLISIWVIFTFINMGFPPFVNFLGEAYIMKMMTYSPFFFFIGMLNFFVVGLYGVLMISNIAQSKNQKYSLKSGSGGLSEFMVFMVISSHMYCFFLVNFLKVMFYD